MQRQQGGISQQHHQSTNNREVDSSFRIIITKVLSITTILLRIILWPLKLISSFIFTKNEFDGLHTGDKAAVAFKTFSQRLSSSSITSPERQQQPANDSMLLFESMGYSKCVAEAHGRNQFLFIYLHSPLHPHSNSFLRMMNEETDDGLSLSSVVSDCVKWGGNIHHAEASKMTSDFQVSSYPFCALLVCKSRSSVEVFWRLDSTVGASTSLSLSDLCAKIGTAIAVYYPILGEEENRRNRRREEVQLREEQDREFQQTLEEDRRREAERQAQQEQERREALQVQHELELAQQLEQSRLDNARSLLPTTEPTLGSNVARLRIMFPSGVRTERRFYVTDTIEMIKAFVILHMHDKSIPITNFQLEMNFPRKVLQDDSLTIEQSGLGKMAALMVVDLDA